MKRKYLILLLCVLALSSSVVVLGNVFDGGWRVSVGAAYNAPTKARLDFSRAKFSHGGIALPVGYGTRADAEKIVAGKEVSETRREYSADGKTFVDKDCSTASGMENGTWNVKVPYDSWDPDSHSFELASAEYVEAKNMKMHDSDESAMPGVTVELSRCIYHNEEYNFGVELAFMFSYFFETDIFKARSYGEVERGKLTSTISPVSGTVDTELWPCDSEGYYGSGSPYWGPVFNLPTISGASTIYRNFHAHGDYRELEMVFALRPYYDLFDWLRIYGTIGPAVSWSEFDLGVDYSVDGGSGRYSNDYDEWNVYGVGGLGLMFRWNDFCLGFDFFGRFLQDDIDVDDDVVHGSIRRSRWMFRGVLGYEF